MARLKIGYLLPTRDQAIQGVHEPGRFVEHARRAEDVGLDSVWAGDSPVTRPRADPLMVLAAAAKATERVSLGTAVLLPALRHPILLAHQLATLDRLSSGRLITGMGGGFPNPATEAQFAALGIEFGRRIGRMTESIDIMRRLWSGEAVSYHGKHFAFEDVQLAPAPSRPGGPPIWLAGSGGPALRRVAQLADGWLPYPTEAGAYSAERQVIEQAGSRSVTPALYATLCLDEDPEKARERLRTSIERYYNAPLEFVASIQAMFAGTAGQAADWLAGYAAAGARHVVIRLAADDHHEGLEEFADQVLPILRDKDSQ
ncbi:LLM class flavin-dependent oxidoreductase [Nocardia cyriacigeorgica]|uniref:LLM class flavin-dependent oxidoreductase n=2 Tax=Nocardia cyriacigeorgica TaxID=135487 RepID=A0A6P1DCL2_9NOCA|nr:LLM class flavin-dependent oxidoreductase [Nocardia cyriacigeorgica]NEW38565.1 LLM class flavin-dependent oxidoreductase [Nocardia cyriacigeorgica]NEW46122.1 LLM class flavin-dependent oxidoreductase [Nocardia cyriacigeorgica]NEW58639.1 LLM class flavin-dependent oxidoreductase [Nocardia cyriacigeorgica]